MEDIVKACGLELDCLFSMKCLSWTDCLIETSLPLPSLSTVTIQGALSDVLCELVLLLYVLLDVGNEVPLLLQNLEYCIADIRLCMTQNLLKLYDGNEKKPHRGYTLVDHVSLPVIH